MKLKIKKGDTVQVITGSQKGMKGAVLAIEPKKMKIRVQGVRVQTHFQELGISRVERFELPKVLALNFVLYDALGGGSHQPRDHDQVVGREGLKRDRAKGGDQNNTRVSKAVADHEREKADK